MTQLYQFLSENFCFTHPAEKRTRDTTSDYRSWDMYTQYAFRDFCLSQILAKMFLGQNGSPFELVTLGVNLNKTRQNSPNCNWRVSIKDGARHKSGAKEISNKVWMYTMLFSCLIFNYIEMLTASGHKFVSKFIVFSFQVHG